MKLFEPPGGCTEERRRCVWLSGPRIAYSSRSFGRPRCACAVQSSAGGPHGGKKCRRGKKRIFKEKKREDSGVKIKREDKSTLFGLF